MAKIRRFLCLIHFFKQVEIGTVEVYKREMIQFTWTLFAAFVGHGKLFRWRTRKSRAMEFRIQRPALHRPVETLTFQAVTRTHPFTMIVRRSTEVALL